MRALTLVDLYSCAGMAADGYAKYFVITGVDKDPQPRYPYKFIQQDVLEITPEWLRQFDIIHASPPCQFGTELKSRYLVNNHRNLIPQTRELLKASGRPYIIENVRGSRHHLIEPIMLCGRMFDGLRVYRHRYFEISGFDIPQPEHITHDRYTHTLDTRKYHFGTTNEWDDFVQVTGGGNCSRDAAAHAMKVSRYLTKRELNEGIPPAYTEYIATIAYPQILKEMS